MVLKYRINEPSPRDCDSFPGEFELIGVLWRDGRSEEVVVDVYGRMTLKEAFETKLLDTDLYVNDLELVHTDRTPRFDISWDSPAYKQKVDCHITSYQIIIASCNHCTVVFNSD